MLPGLQAPGYGRRQSVSYNRVSSSEFVPQQLSANILLLHVLREAVKIAGHVEDVVELSREALRYRPVFLVNNQFGELIEGNAHDCGRPLGLQPLSGSELDMIE